MRNVLLAATLCFVEAGVLLRPSGPTLAVGGAAYAPPPPPAGDAFLATMTPDDLARGLWALQRSGATLDDHQRALVHEAAVLRHAWETARADRRTARATFLADSPALVEACR